MLDQVTAAPPADQDRPAIIVVAPANTGKALADCLARHCGVIDDVNATMRHAEALFAAGKYPDARLTLLRSLARNRGAVDKFPRAVAALYEAGSTVAEHNGDQDEYRSFAFKSAYVIANATSLPPLDRLQGYARAGDIYASIGAKRGGDVDGAFFDRNAAERSYRDAEELARSSGFSELAQILELRRLLISSRPGQSGKQRARLAAIIASPETSARLVVHARTILARLERQDGDTTATDRLIAAVGLQSEAAAPVLAWSPQVPLPNGVQSAAEDFQQGATSAKKDEGIQSYQWADIGYWVRPDGTVADAEVLRSSPGAGWARPIVLTIGKRRYLPSKADGNDLGQYRIERVTLTYEWQVPKGSLIRRRVGAAGYRFADITRAPPPPPSSSSQ